MRGVIEKGSAWALVTGASSGIGFEYARQIAPYVKHIHVFQWREKDKFPLSDGMALWEINSFKNFCHYSTSG